MLVGDAISPPVSLHVLLTGWQTDPLSLLALAVELALAAWYVTATRRLAARGRVWPARRTVFFLAGTALVVIAVQSGLAAYDDQVF
ncbi:MAG TPA: cytochrome c oxidase assembly protein, partial [Acidimicrobiales bacterium]|nr:cytochrome c oxidase assembly protein [Acidimicrobiales bacterium]